MDNLKCHDCGKLLKLNECYCSECVEVLKDEIARRDTELSLIEELVDEQIGIAINKGDEYE